MKKRWLSKHECYQFLDSENVGRLATSTNGEPYIVPVNFVHISDSIFIHSGLKGRKIDNINLNPYVCFEVSREIKIIPADKACKFNVEFISVIVSGKAKIISEVELKYKALKALTNKYAHSDKEPELLIEDIKNVCVIEITADRISGRISEFD